MDKHTSLQESIEALEGKAQELLQRMEAQPESQADVLKDLKSLQEQVQPLLAAREREVTAESLRDMKAQVKTLSETIEEFRSFNPEAGRKSQRPQGESPYLKGEASFFQDILLSKGGDQKARARLMDAKAMTEGTASAGGYLVQDQVADELLELRVANAPLLGILPHVQVNSDTLTFISETGGLTAGWVAELAAKPTADMTFGTLSVSVFTAAGLATVSNQLLQDAGRQSYGPNVGIDSLIVRDLAKRLAVLQEIALINGTGTGQPLGILGTAGVNTQSVGADTTVPVLLDEIVDSIVDVQTNFLANPTHIVMHPRTWARIVKAREASAPSTYLIGAGSTAFGRRGNDPLPGGGVNNGGISGELFGLPVVTTPNMPTNLGAGTNESRVIVGDFSQGLVLDRQAVTVDTSEHVYFTSNQTVFRAELRTGFTAARYPKAFTVISGTGLANG